VSGEPDTAPRWAHLKGRNPYVVGRVESGEPLSIADEHDLSGRMVRSSAVVGLGTALSRLTGLGRTIALAYAVGGLALADGYNLANTTPNMVYDLLIGGILSATLVPVFVDRFEHDDDEGVSAVVSVATAFLLAVTVVAVLAAPWIFKMFTWQDTPAQAAQIESVGVPLLRFFLPQMLFYGLVAMGGAMLNARRRFAAAAFVPVLNNVVVIGVLLLFASRAGTSPTIDEVVNDEGLLWLLGLGTTAGIVAMSLALWPAVRSAGIRLRWSLRWRNPAVRTVARLSGWTFGYVLANQVALVVCLALAGGEADGGASWYTYAFIFFQLPYGLFAVSIMTTVTPELASAITAGDMPRFRDRFAFGGRLIALVVLPSAVGLALLARPVVNVLLGRGSFDAVAASGTADTLVWFAAGLFFFSFYLLALRGFYAMHDTRTPFFINLGENAINVVLAFALVGRYGVPGIAASFSAAYLVASIVALLMLRRRVGNLGGRALFGPIARMAVAAAAMAAVVALVAHTVGADTGSAGLVRIVVAIGAGAVVYFGVALALGVENVRAATDRLLRR
jgi:putative peptidoglycan lipid II flippase